MRTIVAWDGPAPFPGDFLAGRSGNDLWRITGLARRPGGSLSLDLAKATQDTLPATAVVHAWMRMAPHDAEGPARVRQVTGTGPTGVMRSSWRDPDDMRPNAAHRAREVIGYRTYCPLRRMLSHKGSQIDERHIYAADLLRGQVDVAVIGKGARSMELTRRGFGPVAAPPQSALDGVWAMTQAKRALNRLAPSARLLVAAVVLRNNSLHVWCSAILPHRCAKVEMGRLLAALDVLTDHYAAEIDDALARGRMLEVA